MKRALGNLPAVADGRRRGGKAVAACAALVLAVPCAPLFADQSSTKPTDPAPEPDASLLKEVVVTAQKTKQNIQDVPITMSAVSADSIKMNGMIGFRQWGDSVPGMQVTQGSSANRRAGPTAVIRGVSQSNAGQLNEVSSMATTNYTFGEIPVDSGDPALFDLNRVEVLRGPQGALFGLASMGGTVRFIPNDADTHQFNGEFDGGGGTIDQGGLTHHLELMLNAPIIKNVLAVRFSAETQHSDGFITVKLLPLTFSNPKEIFVNGNTAFPVSSNRGIIPNANSMTLSAERLSITYTPTENLEFKMFGMTQSQTQGTRQDIDYNDVSGGWVANRFALEPQDNRLRLFSFDASYLMKFGTLSYIFGSQYRSQKETIDFTSEAPFLLYGEVPALQVNPNLPADPIPSPTTFPFFSQNKISSNELRLQGKKEPLFGSVTFDYLVGLFHMTENASGNWTIADPTWNADRGPNTVPILTDGGLILGQKGGGDFSTSAAFGDLTFNLTSKLSIGGGARVSRDTRTSAVYTYGDASSPIYEASNGATVGSDLNGPGEPSQVGTAHDSSLTPRGVISYHINENQMLYFNAAKGQRAPESLPDPTFFKNSTPECYALAQSLGLVGPAETGTKSDTVWSYDLGLKSEWLDHRLVLNPALYDVRWTGMQLNVLLNQFNAACNQIIAANVGDVEIKGVEFSAKYSPIDDIVLAASVAYADSGLSHDVQGVTSSLGTPLKAGDSVTEAPPWQANASAQYQFPVPYISANGSSGARGFLYADWRYVGERFDEVIGNKDALRVQMPFYVARSYSLTDVRMGLTTEGWTGSVYCSNLFNKRAMYASHQTAWLPNQQIVSVSQPRTIGFDFTLWF